MFLRRNIQELNIEKETIMDEYVFKRLPDNLITLEFEGAIPHRDFLMWPLDLDKHAPLASATTMYSSPMTLIPGTNVMISADKIEGTTYIVYSVQTDSPAE
jgi:hypothetical protein